MGSSRAAGVARGAAEGGSAGGGVDWASMAAEALDGVLYLARAAQRGCGADCGGWRGEAAAVLARRVLGGGGVRVTATCPAAVLAPRACVATGSVDTDEVVLSDVVGLAPGVAADGPRCCLAYEPPAGVRPVEGERGR